MGSGMHTLNWTINDSLVLESTYDIRINGTVVITGNWSAPSDQINLDLNTSLSSWFNTIHFNSTTLNNYTVIVTLDVSDGVLNSTDVVVLSINTLPGPNTSVISNISALNITIGVIITVGIIGAVIIIGVPLLRVFIRIKKNGSK